jgi:PTH1 family peptidyl-tRNA hydrolase
MAYIFLGLGNPGEDYKNTRHNTGRIVLEFFAKEFGFSEFVFDKKINALKSEGKIGKEKVFLVFPETFMNNSGKTVKALGLSVKQVEKLLVVYDDLDLPFLKTKLSYNKSSGGSLTTGILTLNVTP